MAPRFPGLIRLAMSGCLAAPAAGAQQPGDTASSFGTVSGETLRRAGATGLADVLRLAGQWQVSTVDGFAWHAAPLGGSSFTPARWTVLLDGRPMDVDLFGNTNLTRLGVPLGQVAYVELLDFPRLEAGRLTTEGILHIHTLVPESGVAAEGRFATGSEIGDPGPFAFTPRARPNVDRIGHEASGSASYGGGDGSWFVSGSLASGEAIPSDAAIVERYVAALGDSPRLEAESGSLRAGASLAGGRHILDLRHSTLRSAIRLLPFETELGIRERFTRVGLAGPISSNPGRIVVYEVGHTVNRAGSPLDWELRATEGRLELSQPGSTLGTAGVRFRRARVHAAPDVEPITIVGAYAEAGPLSALVTAGEGEVGGAATVRYGWRTAPRSVLEGALTYERRTGAEDNSGWAWSDRGYDLFARSGRDSEIVGAPVGPERIAVDARWEFRPGATAELRVRGLLRRTRRGLAERDGGEGLPAVVYSVGGETAGGSVELGARPWTPLSLRVAWWYQRVIGGESVYRETWAAVPRHGARLIAEYAPVPGLDLWLAAGFRGPSRDLSSAATLDAAVQKWLWDGRIRLHFGVRNLAGADLRYHPAGATFAPTAVFEVEGRFP